MKKLLPTITIAALALTACDQNPSAEREQARETERLTAEANAQIGMPDIVNFQERRFAKQILEMRDTEISTHTYIVNQMQGCLVYLGRSMGFGLPYAVQFTNPEKREFQGVTLPQADPNGLYMPDSLSATWVLLYNENSKETNPVYVEPEIIVTPHRISGAECK